MSGREKSTSITSSGAKTKRPKQSRRARADAQKAKILSFDSKVVGRSTVDLAAEVADPLARAIKALKPRGGVDVIVVSDEGEKKAYVVEAKYSRPKSQKGKVFAAKSRVLTHRLPVDTPRVSSPSTDELAERMLPETPVPGPAQATLAQRESQARWGMLEEFGAFTSEELADQRSQAKNRHALANRWRSEGKVFSVDLRGRRLFPGFQFDPETFAPEPVVADVLAALPRDQMSEWEVALWWVSSDPWLDGQRPVDVVPEDPGLVTAAAAALSEPSPL